MSRTLFLRMLFWSARGARSRFLLLSLSLAVGVSAVVGVLAITHAVEAGIRLHSRELLGGDLALESRRPLPDVTPSLPSALRNAPQVRTWAISTMVRTEAGRTRLIELKAIDQSRGHYPLAGSLLLEPNQPLDSLLNDHTALVAPSLLSELKLKRGDTIYVGGQPLQIAGVIRQEPDPVGFSLTFGPRVLITSSALLRTSLLGFGNRVRYRTLLAFPQLDDLALLRDVKTTLQKAVPGGDSYVTVELHDEAQPALRQMLARVEHYAGLIALLSLLVAGVGVAQTVSAWIRQAAPQTAILRCLGFRPRDVFLLYLALVALFALLGSVLGSLLGALAPLAFARLSPTLVPVEVAWAFPWSACARGLALGLAVPLLASLLALAEAFRAAPALVLRSDALPLPRARGTVAAFVAVSAVGLFLVCLQQSGEPKLSLIFAGSVAGLAGLLVLLARLLAFLLARVPRARLPLLVWHGIAALTRPGSGVVGSVLALGMGTLIVLSIALSSELMQRALASALPPRAPTVFLMDIQPDQWPEVQALAHAAGASQIESAPVVMARLRAIDGVTVSELLAQAPTDLDERQRRQRLLTREQRLSWAKQLPPDNRIVAGKLWASPEPMEMSVESEFARDAGIKLDSVLRFDVQGSELTFRVSSLRTVQWRSFSTNFFMLAEPGSLDGAPYFRLAALRVEPEAEIALEEQLTAALPNVTMLRVRSLIARAHETFELLSQGVQLLGVFAIVSGLLTLTSSVASSQLRRQREVALLKTLGVSRMGVLLMFGLEYALHGLFAGTIGAAGAYVSTWLTARELLDLTQLPSWQLCLTAVLITTTLAVLGGLLASMRALLVRPLQVLRGRG